MFDQVALWMYDHPYGVIVALGVTVFVVGWITTARLIE